MQFYIGLGFDPAHSRTLTADADGLFVWGTHACKKLLESKDNCTSLDSSKFNMVAYMLEMFDDAMIPPENNVSESFGMETYGHHNFA